MYVPDYRLYCLNRAGRFVRCDEFEAPDDSKAIQKAVERKDGAAAELWSGARLVTTFAVTHTDPAS